MITLIKTFYKSNFSFLEYNTDMKRNVLEIIVTWQILIWSRKQQVFRTQKSYSIRVYY